LRREEQFITAALIRKTFTQEVMLTSGLEECIEEGMGRGWKEKGITVCSSRL